MTPASRTPAPLRITPIPGIPAISPQDDLAAVIDKAAQSVDVELSEGVLVVCQKIISKAEGRLVALADVEPSPRAIEIAREDEKDPRHVEVVLRETVRIVRRGHRVMICETRHGFVCANAGVDLSNAPDEEVAVLLPEDSDASAQRLLSALIARGHRALGVIVSDTFGRPWREALVDLAIGSAGINPILDVRGGRDWVGRPLEVTTMATVDQLAAAAGLLMIKDAGIPAVFVEGLPVSGDGGVRDLLRDPQNDLFR
ncbi:MAG: coenzyme F420-0:L-glutamate ligase [bacterium TMED88]|nr:coenzyme F420-0:L-glutamate ligase [Deltaproteobacteria bacterium]OUV29913.1 MAG: coenzyme F420-0:L-glutamate ligase [bacterium TMED88]